jgi:hypothetical protein
MGNFEQGKTWWWDIAMGGRGNWRWKVRAIAMSALSFCQNSSTSTLAQSPLKKDVNYNQSHLELNGVDHCGLLWNN